MWFAAGSAVTATLLSLGHRIAGYGLLYAMASVDYAQYPDDELYQQQCMAGIRVGIFCIQLP